MICVVAVCALCLFLAVPSVGLESAIVVFSAHFLTIVFTVNKDNDTGQTA